MGICHLEENSKYRFGIWKITESEDALRVILGKQMDTPFSSAAKRIEFLAVRALAKTLAIDPFAIRYESSGKPFIMGQSYHISISHTKGYAALLISDLPLTGIDIESKSDRVLRIRSKFMHPEEERQLSGQKENESIALLIHWSAKESIFKAIPDTGVDFIKELRILNFTSSDTSGSFYAKALRSNTTFQVDFRIESDYVLTCCFSTESK